MEQGFAFRGNDESEHSSNHGNFLELLQFLADHNEDVKAVTLKNAPENHKLTSPDIQKDIVNACATETINAIIKDIRTSLFSILIDEFHDVSTKEQMTIVLRYVDKNGHVVERFIGIEHVTSTAALSLKETIDEVFSRHKLSMSRLRGQGYDGANNMQGVFNGLKALIIKENGCAYYIHCFAHQLQLALVDVAKKNIQIESLFSIVTILVNVVGASSKHCDLLREKQSIAIIEALNSGEFTSGKGKNQETTLKRARETRWGSHFGTLVSIRTMFSSILDVLEVIADDRVSSQQRCEANHLLDSMQLFDFVFNLHLMKDILGITNELSQALQRKDQDIVNAMKLVGVGKQRLEIMRKSGWDSLLSEVSEFCLKHNIDVPNKDDMFLSRRRGQRKAQAVTNMHHYRVGIFYVVLDWQLQELNNRFNETNSELLLCLACLCPVDFFSDFDSQKLLRLDQFYPKDFSMNELVILKAANAKKWFNAKNTRCPYSYKSLASSLLGGGNVAHCLLGLGYCCGSQK
ncbi:zinc finger MYM-type protein 1-like [Pyrus x bretschneideri]|uniref:zinc finger MYM-type protein 1-like n=1 Tax=Pyrus x bretschneideri TaxID=225117 RepID=UPI00202FD41F|nr:zinc finger MYM-type protein 1-like [Pyrus x bretschneideri]